jgi:MFS family permease
LTVVIIANGLLRVANSGGGALVGFYLAYLALHGHAVNAVTVGALGFTVYIAELVGALPAGALTDHISPRWILPTAALIASFATLLFGLTGLVDIFFLSRALEGLSAAATSPPLLAHLSIETERAPQIRGRVMSYFELSMLSGLAMGGITGGVLWEALQTIAFSTLALVYFVVMILFWWGLNRPFHLSRHSSNPLATLKKDLSDPLLYRLAPAWLAINAVIGMWLTQIGYQLSGPKATGQFLVGHFRPAQVGVILLGFAIVFTLGILAWGYIMAHMKRLRVLRITIGAISVACLWLFLLNSSGAWPVWVRIPLLSLAALSVLVMSGFTPAALAFLADIADQSTGRGSTMGIYTVLYGLGNGIGAALGGFSAHFLAINGLILVTLGMVVISMIDLFLLKD